MAAAKHGWLAAAQNALHLLPGQTIQFSEFAHTQIIGAHRPVLPTLINLPTLIYLGQMVPTQTMFVCRGGAPLPVSGDRGLAAAAFGGLRHAHN